MPWGESVFVGCASARGGEARGRELGCACARIVAILVLLWPSPGRAAAQISTSSEYQVKATYLLQFPNFVEWPEGAFASPNSTFQICFFGTVPFGSSLAEAARSEIFHGRVLELRLVSKLKEMRACQVLFVGHSESRRYARVLAEVAGRQVLTVGETYDFLTAGGAVCLSFENQILQLEVNLTAVNDAGLKVSPQLLTLAKRVVNLPKAAKG
jgi:YfiR/HmsC-like